MQTNQWNGIRETHVLSCNLVAWWTTGRFVTKPPWSNLKLLARTKQRHWIAPNNEKPWWLAVFPRFSRLLLGRFEKLNLANRCQSWYDQPRKSLENPWKSFLQDEFGQTGRKRKAPIFPIILIRFLPIPKTPMSTYHAKASTLVSCFSEFFFGSATSSGFGKSLCASSSAFRRPLQGLNCWEALHLNLLGYLLSLNEGEMFNGRKNRRFLKMPESVARCCIFRTVKKVKGVYKCTHTTMYICI